MNVKDLGTPYIPDFTVDVPPNGVYPYGVTDKE
jgi:hypothetical protein